jgi:hypothetical protein
MGVTLCGQEEIPDACSEPIFLSDTFSAIQIINFDTYHNQLLIIPYYFDCYSLLDATSLLSFSRHQASCSTCSWSQKKAHTMATTTAAVACPNDKCSFRQHKILVEFCGFDSTDGFFVFLHAFTSCLVDWNHSKITQVSKKIGTGVC